MRTASAAMMAVVMVMATPAAALAQAAASRGYVAGVAFLDVVRGSGPEVSIPEFDLTADGEAPGGAVRGGFALGERWGVEAEFAYPARIEKETAWPGAVLASGGFAPGTPGSTLPAFPDLPALPFFEYRQTVSARTVTTSAHAYVSRPLGGRVDLVVLGGVAFASARETRSLVFPVALADIGALLVAPQDFVTRSVRPSVGAEVAIRVAGHADVVAGVRALGAKQTSGDALLVRPSVGVRWRF